jgi:hypothetical protein
MCAAYVKSDGRDYGALSDHGHLKYSQKNYPNAAVSNTSLELNCHHYGKKSTSHYLKAMTSEYKSSDPTFQINILTQVNMKITVFWEKILSSGR